MTRKTRAEERIDELDTSPATLTAQLEALTVERDEALAKADEYVGLLQRERAEFTNFKRRTAEERQRDLGLAGVDLITKVLNLADDFDRGIETRPGELDGVGREVDARHVEAQLVPEPQVATDAAPEVEEPVASRSAWGGFALADPDPPPDGARDGAHQLLVGPKQPVLAARIRRFPGIRRRVRGHRGSVSCAAAGLAPGPWWRSAGSVGNRFWKWSQKSRLYWSG